MFENNKVYIDYNDNLFNFQKVDEAEKIIEVDLDNCEIKGGKDKDKFGKPETPDPSYRRVWFQECDPDIPRRCRRHRGSGLGYDALQDVYEMGRKT